MFQKLFIIPFIVIQMYICWSSSYKISYSNTKTFEIASDDENYNDEEETEMIQPIDLAEIESHNMEDKYKPLHSYVEQYNRYAADNKMQLSNAFPYLYKSQEEKFNFDNDKKQLIFGFKENLDKKKKRTMKVSQDYLRSKMNIIQTQKRSSQDVTTQGDIGFFQILRPKNDTTWKANEMDHTMADFQTVENTEQMYEYENEIATNMYPKYNKIPAGQDQLSTTEGYDYESLKAEYHQQMTESGNLSTIFKYTNNVTKVKTTKEALKDIWDDLQIKNCTHEEFGYKTIKCMARDFQLVHNKINMNRTLSRIWLVLKVWFILYMCLAIPCWCQRGWCCCCFRCKFCFPEKRIMLAKEYYVNNPCGKLLQQHKETAKLIEYAPTQYEQDAYEMFEVAIRNI